MRARTRDAQSSGVMGWGSEVREGSLEEVMLENLREEKEDKQLVQRKQQLRPKHRGGREHGS